MKLYYSYQNDPNIPAFDDSMPIAVMDGECALCTFGARMIDRFDRAGNIRICPIQTNLGQALLSHYDMSIDDPSSWLFIAHGRCWASFDAWIKVAEQCGGVGHLMRIFWVLPKFVRDWIYQRVARNRIQWFGRADMCAVPSESLKNRLIGLE